MNHVLTWGQEGKLQKVSLIVQTWGVKVAIHCGTDKSSTHIMFLCGTKALSFRKKSSKLLGHSEELLLRERNIQIPRYIGLPKTDTELGQCRTSIPCPNNLSKNTEQETRSIA